MACDCTLIPNQKINNPEGYYYNRYSIANDGTFQTDRTGRNVGGIVNTSQFGNWRVAQNSDFGNLFNYLGGASIAGGPTKSPLFFNPPNTGATNSAHFNIRGTGSLSYLLGASAWSQRGDFGQLWSGSAGSPVTRSYNWKFDSTAVTTSNNTDPKNCLQIRLCRELIECEDDFNDFSLIPNAYTGNNGLSYYGVKIGTLIWINQGLSETLYNDATTIYNPVSDADWYAQPTNIGIIIKGLNHTDTGANVDFQEDVNECTDEPCQCLKLDWESASGSFPTENYNLETLGLINGRNYYEFDTPTYTNTLRLSWRTQTEPVGFPATPYWTIADSTNADQILAILQLDSLCPAGTDTQWNGFGSLLVTTESAECGCGVKEERIEKSYGSIKLPDNFQETPRGDKSCCCEYLVLGNAGSESWKSDITSAWIKASSPSDLIEFKLIFSDQEVVLPKTAFANEPFAFYTTIEWKDILATYGVGCYELRIQYTIAGVVDSQLWGVYNLEQFTTENALNTARIRAKFNGYHEQEGINFSGSNIESTFRFHGYIGGRQPNTEIDNIIYGNREMKRVIRENLNSYEICTDPSLECITRPLVDLYLLSENELYISDYNAHNHSYRYNDIPVIVEESPALEYYDFSRKAKLTCIVSDKFKNKRTYY